jgi:hypothetical protein
VADRGDEVGEALAGAGARLNEQVIAGEHRVLDSAGHGQLAVTRFTTDPGNGEGEQFLDAGNLRCSHGSKGSWQTLVDRGAHPQAGGRRSLWNQLASVVARGSRATFKPAQGSVDRLTVFADLPPPEDVVKPSRSSAPEVESPWAASILPGRPFVPAAAPPQATFAGPAQPVSAPVPMAPATASGYPMGAPGSPADASFEPQYAAASQFGGPQLPPQQFGRPQQFGAQPQIAPPAQIGNGGRAHRGRAGTSRTSVLLVVAVVLALAGGGYYEAPKLLASKKAPTVAPVAHHAGTAGAAVPGAAVPSAAVPGAAVPSAAVPSAAVPSAAVPSAAVPGAGTATAASGANTSRGVTLPATLNGMPKLTDPASIAAATALLASVADTNFAFKENSSAAVYRLNPTTVVTVAATVGDDSDSDVANVDRLAAEVFLPGSADLKPTPVVGAASPAWIECETFTDLGNAAAENPNAKPATNCLYASAAVVAAIVVPSPRGTDETAVAMAIGKQLH